MEPIKLLKSIYNKVASIFAIYMTDQVISNLWTCQILGSLKSVQRED